MLQLRLYLLLMLHLLILGQQQLGPRLDRRLVWLPPLLRVSTERAKTARSQRISATRRERRGSSEASVRPRQS